MLCKVRMKCLELPHSSLAPIHLLKMRVRLHLLFAQQPKKKNCKDLHIKSCKASVSMPILMTSLPTPSAPPLPLQPHWPPLQSLNLKRSLLLQWVLLYLSVLLLHRGIRGCAFSSSGLSSEILYQKCFPWEPCLTWLLPFAPFLVPVYSLVLWKVPPLHYYFTACFLLSPLPSWTCVWVLTQLLSHVWSSLQLFGLMYQALCPWDWNTGVHCHFLSGESSPGTEPASLCVSCTSRQILPNCITWSHFLNVNPQGQVLCLLLNP